MKIKKPGRGDIVIIHAPGFAQQKLKFSKGSVYNPAA
jgi:hypothetical protein